jgi:two-component system chemotaxis response regulator CheY
MEKSSKVLLADDSAFMRKVLKDILEGIGFTNFIEAENGVEAIEKFNAEKPSLVMLDIIMPVKNGIDVLKEIGKKAQIIVVSAVGQDGMIEEAKTLGAVDYIIKPFDRAQVEEKIAAL